MRDCVVYLGTANWKARAVAMLEAVKAEGWEVYQIAPTDLETLARLVQGDRVAFAVTVGMHRPELAARSLLEASGVPVMVLDLGYFRRASGPDDEDGYNQAGWGRIGWVPSSVPDGERWEALGLPLEACAFPGEVRKILALGQVEGDSQHGLDGQEMESWLWGTALRVKREYGTPETKIVLRKHPKQAWRPCRKWDGLSYHADLAADLAVADVVVTYNSTAGLEALRLGKWVECSDAAFYRGWAGSLKARRVATNNFDPRREGWREDREGFFHRVAWAQWTIEELRDGTALRFLLPEARIGGAA
ncbi:MAG: hypothetical protein ACQKBU_00045 [Verrucomicrobiales bacterium]